MNKKKKFRELSTFQETHRNEDYRNLSFTVVLVRPENAGNIGAIARVMKNFDFDNLVVFNPIESVQNIHSHEAQGFAMHGKSILMNASIITVENQENHFQEYKKFLRSYDLVIGTSAKGKRYTNLRRLAIFPDDLTLPFSRKPLNVAILFGRESRGLTNDEVSLTDVLLRIPTSSQYSALNISHACGIILYELFKKLNVVSIGRGRNPVLLADKEDRVILLKFIKLLIEKLKVGLHRQENIFFAFKNVFERAFMSKKELSLITGIFSKLSSIIKDLNLYEKK